MEAERGGCDRCREDENPHLPHVKIRMQSGHKGIKDHGVQKIHAVGNGSKKMHDPIREEGGGGNGYDQKNRGTQAGEEISQRRFVKQ